MRMGGLTRELYLKRCGESYFGADQNEPAPRQREKPAGSILSGF
ncbi:MAG: hypothetical protein ACJA2D_002335 [Pseudohongiellaceae bacterium]|jgi:hypothetical protein